VETQADSTAIGVYR